MFQKQLSDPEQLLRDMRDDLRFLSYRAGRTPSIVIKFFLLNILVFLALCFVAEIYALFFTAPSQAAPRTSQPHAQGLRTPQQEKQR